MQAMVMEAVAAPLRERSLPDPAEDSGELLIGVRACGVCRTDLHILDGELPEPTLPLVLGHQIVGDVLRVGSRVGSQPSFHVGQRVGVPWLGGTCGSCRYCRQGMENLCDRARFTGFHVNGGYAQLTVADPHYCFPLPEGLPDDQAAPLLCAGLIGYRAYGMIGEGHHIGFYGFGSAAHILMQVARYEGKMVYAFTRPGDSRGQQFALELGAAWAGGSNESPPVELDSAIIFAPVGALVPAALRAVRKAGVVVCAGIHMSDIPGFPYSDLWNERVIRSVANLTRRDGEEFLSLAPRIPIRSRITEFRLDQANEALKALRSGAHEGSIVLRVEQNR
jgi:propanol-preferring alcohol dehydrogenase